MSAELQRVLERVRQNRAARARATDTGTGGAATDTGPIRRTISAGARVFDTVTGLEGEVLSAGVENVVVPGPGRNDR